MTRHELKEQVQHDAFADSVGKVVDYTTTHRDQVIRWAVAGAAVLIVILVALWYSNYRSSQRQQDLEAAMQVVSAPVGQSTQFAKSYPTEQAKRQAEVKALSEVVAKDGNSREGMIARYYLGTVKIQTGDKSGESDLKAVANSSYAVSSLGKIALAHLYAGENRVPEAQELLRTLVNNPTTLVSKDEAALLLAQLDTTTNPAQARKILQDMKPGTGDPAVARAANEISSQLSR